LYRISFRQQDEELDDITANVQNIGGVGLTIRGELSRQVFVTCMQIRRQTARSIDLWVVIVVKNDHYNSCLLHAWTIKFC
jgi:hypothetical protein